jgi:hypothetical protein
MEKKFKLKDIIFFNNYIKNLFNFFNLIYLI